MNKVELLIDNMSREELTELKQKIETGLINQQIQKKLERFKNMNSVCPVCNTPVGKEGLTLLFGPQDMRQKAVFDGADCLEYFLDKIKK